MLLTIMVINIKLIKIILREEINYHNLFRGNPYAQDNIQLYLDKNNSNLVLII